MAFDIQEFRSSMVGDGARPNLFEVAMTLPGAGFAGGLGDFARKLRFTCRTAQLPGSTVGQVPTYYFGREIKLAGNRVFPEWTVTVLNDEDFVVRNSIEKWMNGLNSHRGNLRDPSALNNNQYTTDAEVLQYGKRGVEIGGVGIGGRPGAIKQYKFIGLFPIDVSPIDLDWGSNDVVEEFSVSFAYNWWESTTDGVTT